MASRWPCPNVAKPLGYLNMDAINHIALFFIEIFQKVLI